MVDVRMDQPAHAGVEPYHVFLARLTHLGKIRPLIDQAALLENVDKEFLDLDFVALDGAPLGVIRRMPQRNLRHVMQILALETEYVGSCLAAPVVEPPCTFEAWIGDLFLGVGELQGRCPLAVMLHGHQLIDTAERRLARRGDKLCAYPKDQTLDDRLRIESFPR